MAGGVTDKLGFVNEGKYLCTILPAKEAFLLFQVLARKNKGFERIDYGPLPIQVAGHDDGVVPAGQIVPSPTTGWKISAYRAVAGDRVVGLEEIKAEVAGDIFYHTDENVLFHYILDIKPRMLKHIVMYPDRQPQTSFREQTAIPTADFGVFNGQFETVVLPKVHVSYQTYNPTNLDLRTYMTIYYAQYNVRPVKDEEKVREVLRKGLAKIMTLPYNVTHEQVEKVLEKYKGALFSVEWLEEARW